jgi:hypothetical protein
MFYEPVKKGAHGSVVVKALYKLEGHGFEIQ